MRLVDIAKALNLSHTTVSRAMNPERQHLISAQTREEVRAYAKKVRFVPNKAARDLVTGKSRTIGVLLPTVFDSLFFNEQLANTLAGLHKTLGGNRGCNYKLLILPTEASMDEMNQGSLSIGIDGLLISGQYDYFSKLAPFVPKELLEYWDKAVVFINVVPQKSQKLNVVSFDNFEAARMAGTYLIRKGHKRIGLISGEDDLEESKERHRGYLKAMEEHCLPVRSSLIVRGRYSRESGYKAALEILSMAKASQPTAVFAINDEMAIGAMEAIKSLGLRCPQDVAVMGFDGLETGNHSQPRLTTVRQPSREIARAGTELLLDLIENREQTPVVKMIPTEVVVRDSA